MKVVIAVKIDNDFVPITQFTNEGDSVRLYLEDGNYVEIIENVPEVYKRMEKVAKHFRYLFRLKSRAKLFSTKSLNDSPISDKVQ